MAYRIGKAPGSDVNVSRIIDEITFALNDLDKRLTDTAKSSGKKTTTTTATTPAATYADGDNTGY